MKTKIILPLLALTLLVGVFLFPLTAYAQTTDTTPPTVSAKIDGDILRVTAQDDDSGVAAVYVNETRFSTLVNGTASVRFKDYAGNGAQFAVSAVDMAGNRSESVMIDNPYYAAPTTQPSSTPTAPSTATPLPAPTSTPKPAVTSTPDPVIALPEVTPTPDSEGDSNTPGASESVIPNGANAFTPDGSGTVMDNATEEDGKEFFTITTAEGSVYYLIIDRQRGTENIYFLSTVTKADLVDLTENGADTSPGLAQPDPQLQTPAQTPAPEPAEQPAQDEGGVNLGVILFILIATAAVGGVAYYVKIVKPRKQAAQADGYEEYEEDDDGEDNDEYFFDETDEYHPGEPDDEN